MPATVRRPRDPVWYVSYGSNMCAERLRAYLVGGSPPGGDARHPGCRDAAPPADSAGVTLPGRMYFAGHSGVWDGGGVCFYDHDAPGPTPARAYLVTAGQFADIAAQEAGRAPGPHDPVATALRRGLPRGRLELGPGYYETLLAIGALRGLPMFTFTTAAGCDEAEHTAPSRAYLTMLAEGLRQAHGWTAERCAEYFAERGALPRS